MKISRLELAGSTARPAYQLDRFAPGLNVVTGPAGAGKSALADCIAHLIYGRRNSRAYRPSGTVDIESDRGEYRLRCVPQADGTSRTTIASLGSDVAAPETLPQILGGCPSQFLSGLCYVDGAQPANVDWLLSEGVAREVARLLGRRNSASPDFDHRNEMLARRDELAEQVAQLLAERKRASESLGRRMGSLARQRAEIASQAAQAREDLHTAQVERVAASAHNRYRELELHAEQFAREQELTLDEKRLDEVDEQIARWQATLHELECRESQVRAEIARTRPIDGAAALPLADQRAALAVAERLIEDLRTEVAQFARSVASNKCVCRDAHPRLQPLVSLLEQQLARLVALNDDCERAMRWRELQTEAGHLARSQAELRDQLEHLQEQRAALSRRSRPRRWRSTDASLSPVTFSDFNVDSGDSERRIDPLARVLEELERRLRELDQEHERIVSERSALLSERLLEAKQAELAEVQRQLQLDVAQLRALTLPARQTPTRCGLRSSGYLAQLTDGKYIELKLSAGGRSAYVVDSRAQMHSVHSLSHAEQILVAISLRLAIVAGLAEAEFRVPIILDEPFAQLSDRQSAILAGVMCEFTSQQVLVFTDRQVALEQFRSWNAAIHELRNLNRTKVATERPPQLAAQTTQEPPQRSEESDRRKSVPLRVQRGSAERSPRRRSRSERSNVDPAQRKKKKFKRPTQPKFCLELQSSISKAFAIPPETVQQLVAAGVREIRDLLAADASKLAERLGDATITPVDIVAWQHQARLCCRIPNLRPRDAALLVGAGFSTPEDIVSMKPAELLGFIQSFAQSNDGCELAGVEGLPDLGTVECWIRAARQSRALGAA